MSWTEVGSTTTTWTKPNKYVEILPLFKFDTNGHGFDFGKFGHAEEDGGSVFWTKAAKKTTTWTVS